MKKEEVLGIGKNIGFYKRKSDKCVANSHSFLFVENLMT